MKMYTTGREASSEFFEQSGIRDFKKLSHTPILLFFEDHDEHEATVEIFQKPQDILEYPDEIQAMMQWRGEWSSDFFKFTVGDFRQHILKNPPSQFQRI